MLDREKLVALITDATRNADCFNKYWVVKIAERLLESGVVVKRGHWIARDDTFTKYRCSVCGTGDHHVRWNFCPACGADMRRDNNAAD